LTGARSGQPIESDTDHELRTSRFLKAPRERVFQAFAEAERLAQWWGPHGFTNTFHAFQLRAGATWRYTMHGPNGADYANESVFVEVVRPERIVIDHVSAPRFRLTITLASEAGQTRITWRQRFPSAAERDKIEALAVRANEENLDRLEAEVARLT
jgi:uncharacterized protein YndB with AHSA1/START domain